MEVQSAQIGFDFFHLVCFMASHFSFLFRTHHCVGVVEGSVPEEAPPLPSAVLREFPDFKEMGERELQGICEHLSKRF